MLAENSICIMLQYMGTVYDYTIKDSIVLLLHTSALAANCKLLICKIQYLQLEKLELEGTSQAIVCSHSHLQETIWPKVSTWLFAFRHCSPRAPFAREKNTYEVKGTTGEEQGRHLCFDTAVAEIISLLLLCVQYCSRNLILSFYPFNKHIWALSWSNSHHCFQRAIL